MVNKHSILIILQKEKCFTRKQYVIITTDYKLYLSIRAINFSTYLGPHAVLNRIVKIYNTFFALLRTARCRRILLTIIRIFTFGGQLGIRTRKFLTDFQNNRLEPLGVATIFTGLVQRHGQTCVFIILH